MEVAQLLDGLRSNERSVAVEHDDEIVGRESLAGDHQGVSGAALLALQHESDSGGGDGVPNAIGFVSDDGIHIAGRNDFGRGRDHVRQQRLAADFVQHLGMLGLQPRPFTRCQDGDGDAGSARLSLFVFGIRSNIPREVRAGQGLVTVVTGSMWARASRLYWLEGLLRASGLACAAELRSAGQVRTHCP